MSKYKFSMAERFAVWETHRKCCFWCMEPLALQETTIDHVIPESIVSNSDEFDRIKCIYGLENAFDVNSYSNWVPTHQSCNNKKSDTVFRAGQVMLSILERLERLAGKARNAQARIESNNRSGEILAKVQVLYEQNKIKKEDLIAICAGDDLEDQQLLGRFDELILRVDKSWKVGNVQNDMAFVTRGRFGGITPVGKDVHHSWACPSCGSYGPWNGARCMNCGNMSDEDL